MEEKDYRLSEISIPEKGEDDDQFPIGLKVLAIDANIVCLKYLVQLLLKCQYKVTSTMEAAEAIRLIKDEKESFDIVITDVVRQDMDGFKLLEVIGLEMDIPVVMVSANDELDTVKRGVIEGAEAYLLKPVRLPELRNIWQHVLRKRHRKKISNPNITMDELLLEYDDHRPNSSEIRVSDRKDDDESDKAINPYDSTNVASSSSSKKKPRVNWTKELHAKFVEAYEQLGEKERVPNNILKLMNEPRLTRENVASHLQKHRDGLRKKKTITGVGKFVGQKNYYVRNNPTKLASTIYNNSINDQRNKASNLRPQLLTNAQFQYSHLPNSTDPSGYYPLPQFKWFNFPSNQSILKPCDQFLTFSPNNTDPYYTQYPLGSNCLNSAAQTFGNNCPIDVSAIPQEAAPVNWSFPNNTTTTGQCSQMQFDNKGNAHGGLVDDDLNEIFKQIHSEGAF